MTTTSTPEEKAHLFITDAAFWSERASTACSGAARVMNRVAERLLTQATRLTHIPRQPGETVIRPEDALSVPHAGWRNVDHPGPLRWRLQSHIGLYPGVTLYLAHSTHVATYTRHTAQISLLNPPGIDARYWKEAVRAVLLGLPHVQGVQFLEDPVRTSVLYDDDTVRIFPNYKSITLVTTEPTT